MNNLFFLIQEEVERAKAMKAVGEPIAAPLLREMLQASEDGVFSDNEVCCLSSQHTHTVSDLLRR